MTRRHPTARADAWTRRPPAGVLVRYRADESGWTARVPAAPATGVTVSLSSRTVAVSSAQGLGALGYDYVGLSPAPAAPDGVADFLVPQTLIDAHPDWWRTFAAGARQVFSLALGPVVVTLAGVLDTHLAPPGR